MNKYQGYDPVLTNVAIGFINDAYIAEQIFPSYPVKYQSGKHWIYNRAHFTNTKSLRAAGSPSNEVTLTLTTGQPYFADDHALKQFVPDEDVDNATTPTDPYTDATENVKERLLVGREVELAAQLTSTTVMTQNTTLSGTSQFNDYSNSDPFAVIDTGVQTVHAAIHQNPNVAIMGRQVWDKIKHHPAFLERVKYTQKGVVGTDLLASLLGVDRILIGESGQQTAKEGQSESMSYIWGKDIVLAYVAPRIGVRLQTLGLTYTWKTMKVQRLRGSDEEDRKGTYVRAGEWYYDQQIVSVAAGYLVKNAVA